MPNYALVNKEDHKDLRIRTNRSADLGDNVMFALTFPAEFRSVQTCYPILFHKTGDGDFIPVALFGFEKGENLFLDETGWHASYIPAMIRKEPFLIGHQDSADDTSRVLSLDLDSPRVNTEQGEALFMPLGEMTDYLQTMAAMLEDLYNGHEESRRFVRFLRDEDLLESVTFDITLQDGSRNSLLGFYTINEEKVAELSAETLHLMNQNGYLMPVFMAMASLGKVHELINLKNEKVRG